MDRIIEKTEAVFVRLSGKFIINLLRICWIRCICSVTNARTLYGREFCPKISAIQISKICVIPAFLSLSFYKNGTVPDGTKAGIQRFIDGRAWIPDQVGNDRLKPNLGRHLSLFLNLIFISSLFYSFSIGQVYAEVPVGKIAYQGRLTDSNNTPLTGSYNFTFKIFDAASGGNQLWTETQNSVSVDNGLLSVNLGDGSPISGVIFNGATTYLEITVNTNSPMTPRIRLLPSPYAFNSQTLQGYGFNAFVTTFSAQTIVGDKTFTGTINPATDLSVGGAGFKVIFSSNVVISGTGQDALKITGGLIAGSGNVGIIDTTGKIPAINSTYFSSLDGSALTNISATNIPSGSTSYIQNRESLQSGATFFVASGTVQGTLTSVSGFVGVGSALTSLNASNLALGTVPNERIDSSSVTKVGASAYTTIQNNGTNLNKRPTINFTGDGVTTTDDATVGVSSISIPGIPAKVSGNSSNSNLSLSVTESEVLSATITLRSSSSRVLVLAYCQVNNNANTLFTGTVRIRRGITNSDTLVAEANTYQTNVSAQVQTVPIMTVDSPGIAGTATYTLRALISASTVDVTFRSLVLMEVGP